MGMKLAGISTSTSSTCAARLALAFTLASVGAVGAEGIRRQLPQLDDPAGKPRHLDAQAVEVRHQGLRLVRDGGQLCLAE
jgi:hypothetical protein